MSTAIGWSPRLPESASAGVRAYVQELATWADADGDASVMRRTLAKRLGVSERTVSRWHAGAELLGLVARVDGGHRGAWQTIRLTCRHGLDRTARAARWVVLRRQQARRKASAQARAKLSAGKGDRAGASITLTGMAAPVARASHDYKPSDDGPYCVDCGLPAANARHL